MKQQIVKVVVFSAILACGGCGLAGLLGTPTRYEQKVKAEYNLAAHKKQKMLVLVNQPAWLDAKDNLRYPLTEAMGKSLAKKVKIPAESIIGYETLSQFRSNQVNFSRLAPDKIGRSLGVDYVLLVVIGEYSLTEVPQTNYYKGQLSAEAVLIDAANGVKLWPAYETGRRIRVGFDAMAGDREIAVNRLADACAYCTVRFFYDCSVAKFKIAEDRSDVDLEKWQQ
jgi:hypothetical protein